MATISVTQLAGNRFQIEVRGHRLLVDQPHRWGGEDAGPTPTELFVASLAACVGHYATEYLRRHELPFEGLRVDCEWRMLAADHARVGRIGLRVTPPAPVPPELRPGLEQAVEHCTVHNSLRQPPEITIGVTDPAHVEANAPL
ncbi:MAG TPA: OsmC family protein [Natronosporangium sp.]